MATGLRYVRAAMASARSVHEISPSLKTHLFADYKSSSSPHLESTHSFDSISNIVSPHRRSKLEYLSHTPFDKTLFLDAATKVIQDIHELFQLPDRFDIVLNHAPARNRPNTTEPWNIELPPSFSQFNSGVLLYSKKKEVLELFLDWQRAYREAGFRKDQTTLRDLLWKSNFRIATLPPEYNVMFNKYLRVSKKYEAEAKILHFHRFIGRPLLLQKTIRTAKKIGQTKALKPFVKLLKERMK